VSRNDELRALTSAWNDAWNSRDASKLAGFFADTP
jgi:ketosteroid isomerase-like protein